MSQTHSASPLALPPVTLQEKVAVALGRATARLIHQAEQVLKEYDLTLTQYNALRVINGAGTDGLCGTEVGRRLISQVPDVTRLLDRLEEAGLIVRERDPENRRFVTARITRTGKQQLVETATVLSELHKRQFTRLTQPQLRQLLDLLEQNREVD